jgi:hypothetical protein
VQVRFGEIFGALQRQSREGIIFVTNDVACDLPYRTNIRHFPCFIAYN